MIRKIKRKIRHLLGIKNDTDYYSQAGEDAIVSKSFSYLLPVKKGFYIDIGAYHPYKHSNTYILYKDGWSGMNIDPRPGSKKMFEKYRGRDINIEAGIASKDGNMTYYMLGETSTMNTFSKENLIRLGLLEKVKKVVDVPVYALDTLLKQHKEIQYIDYLNIDAEGFEMEILMGLDFSNISPTIISLEQNHVFGLKDVLDSQVSIYMADKGYIPYAKNIILADVSTVFYCKADRLQVKN